MSALVRRRGNTRCGVSVSRVRSNADSLFTNTESLGLFRSASSCAGIEWAVSSSAAQPSYRGGDRPWPLRRVGDSACDVWGLSTPG